MKIRRIRLREQYKRFFDLTIDLGDDPKRIVALVGPNGCGKSSVLDGLLYRNNVHGAIGNKGTRAADYHSMVADREYNYENIDIEFVEGTYKDVRQQKEQLGKPNTIFSFRSSYRYNANLKVSELKAVSDLRGNGYGASTAVDIDDKMEESYRRLNIHYNKYLHGNDCRPSEAKAAIIGELNNSIRACLELEITSLGDIEANRGSLYFAKPDHPNEFEFNLLSSGEKEVVDLLVDLYLRKDEFDNSVFLIDEPELHINTAIQRKLLTEINRMVGPNCQIWVATHSIGFLRALQDELKDNCQVIQFDAGRNWASEAIVLTPMELTRTNWQSIFHTALDDLTKLVAPEILIYCEGKLNLSLDEKIFNSVFQKKYPNALFLSSTNKSESEKYAGIALTILNRAFEGAYIRVVQDRDDAATPIPAGSTVEVRKLERREFENYLFDWEIFHKAYPASSQANFDAIVSDIVNDDVKSKSNDLQNLAGEANNKNFRLTLAAAMTADTSVYQKLETIIFMPIAAAA